MSTNQTTQQVPGYESVQLDRPIWERFPIVAPLGLVSTTEPDG